MIIRDFIKDASRSSSDVPRSQNGQNNPKREQLTGCWQCFNRFSNASCVYPWFTTRITLHAYSQPLRQEWHLSIFRTLNPIIFNGCVLGSLFGWLELEQSVYMLRRCSVWWDILRWAIWVNCDKYNIDVDYCPVDFECKVCFVCVCPVLGRAK